MHATSSLLPRRKSAGVSSLLNVSASFRLVTQFVTLQGSTRSRLSLDDILVQQILVARGHVPLHENNLRA
jgi:hypothetical protein